MAHAYDRTLLSSLGFQDPDKRNDAHDELCRFVGRPDVATHISCGLVGERGGYYSPNGETKARANFEHPISKGHGQYKTTIGFVDVVLFVPRPDIDKGCGLVIPCEIKVRRLGVGDILRQINLYREYTDEAMGRYWFLMTAWDQTEGEIEQLKSQRVIATSADRCGMGGDPGLAFLLDLKA